MRKILPALALVAAAALGLTGCNLHIGPYAAIVDGKVISQGTLDAALSSAAGDSGYVCSLTNNYQQAAATYGVDAGTYDAHFTAYVLGIFVRAQLAADEASAKGLQVTSILLPLATEQATSSLGSSAGCAGTASAIFSKLSPAYQQAQLTFYENLDLLGAAEDGVTLTSAGLAAYVASNPAAGQLTCIDFIQTSTKAAADAAETALGKGTSFADVAATASTAQTDSAGCAPLSALPSQLAAPLPALANGGYTKPIPYQGGYVILEVAGRQQASPTQLAGFVVGKAEQHFTTLLSSIDRSTSVQIDPAYGKWSGTGGSGQPIADPVGPPAPFVLSTGAATPAPVTAPSTTVPGA